jgi:hypothetical protein
MDFDLIGASFFNGAIDSAKWMDGTKESEYAAQCNKQPISIRNWVVGLNQP